MNRLYSLMAALLLSASTLSAQNVTSRDFNDIKRSKQYFYYDITMEKEDEAKNAANVNLAKLINDYCVENSITNVKVKDTDLKNVKYLKMDKNGMVRILAYVEKNTYIGESKAAEISAVVDKTPQKDIVAVVKIEQKPEKKPEHKSEPKPEQKKVLPPSSHPSAEAAGIAKNEAASSLSKWQQEVLENLCEITSAEKLMMRLSELQNQYKVKRFGLKNDCKNEKGSFWVVYDSNKNVMAILGPGDGERYNFMKGVNENLEDFLAKGLNAIWFQLSK